MARRHPRPEPEDEEDDEPTPARRPAPAPRRRSARATRRPAVQRWEHPGSDPEDDEEGDDEPAAPRHGGRRSDDVAHRPAKPGKEPVFFRARDSVFFEALVATAIVVVLFAGLIAYTQNFPPMYVVESSSMQHGSTDQVGIINTGDLVLAQKVSADQVVTYVTGAQTGYTTYGEYGDVILYHADGLATGAPIIHRALVYIEANADLTYSFPSLAGQLCGSAPGAVYSISSTPTGCGTTHETGTLTLFHVGWRSVTVRIDLASIGEASGFITMGDNNFNPSNTSLGDPDQPSLSTAVEPGWIVGVARGMLPWFGALKLLVEGNAGEVPSQSWEWMGLTVVGLILIAIGIHSLFRAEGIEDERRKEDEAEERARHPPGRWSWRHPLRSWGEEDDEEEDDGGPPARPPRGRPSEKSPGWFGRPKPEVGRSPRKRRGSASRDDEDDDL
jgi:signal peptidase I